MTDANFLIFRSAFQHALSEKPLFEVKAHKRILKLIQDMSPRQIQHLLDDMAMIIDYKSKDNPTNEAWESIERGFSL